MLAPVIRRQRKAIWNMLVEKQELKLLINLDEILKKFPSSQNWKPPKRVFSTTIPSRDMKLGTHTQVHNTDTPAKFQGHSPIITPFTLHMCDFQGHCANIVHIAIYLYDHFRM